MRKTCEMKVLQTSAEVEGPALQDESVDQMSTETSTEVEGPTTQDTTTHHSARGKVKRKEYRWRKVQFEPPAVEFDECVEEALEDRGDWTPKMYFKQFVTDEMLPEIAEQTNLHSVQKQGKSVNTTNKEIDQVLGIYMHMGLV